MVDILKHAYNSRPQKYRGGRKKKLSVEEQLMLTLKYHRFYITQKALAFEFEIGEATVCDTIRWVEDILIKDGTFSLPGKKALLEDDSIEVVLVDVTECPIERPKKNSVNRRIPFCSAYIFRGKCCFANIEGNEKGWQL